MATERQVLIVTVGKQIARTLNIMVYSTETVVLHNCTEVFIAALNKPKRFSCINPYHFNSFEVISVVEDRKFVRE